MPRSVKTDARYTVGLTLGVATQVKRYARKADTSVSKAIAALVQLGLERREKREAEFMSKLRANLDSANNPPHQDPLVDEFRDLILGRR